MCIHRKIEECSYDGYIEYEGQSYFLIYNSKMDSEALRVLVENEKTGERRFLAWGTEVVSHHLSPIERRKYGWPACERGSVPIRERL